MVKCAICSKVINKKSPGLRCVKCSKWIHGPCANLTPDQLSTLFDTDSAEWKCINCTGTAKPKRLSFIMPDPEEEVDTDAEQQIQQPASGSTTNKMMCDIRREVREVVRLDLQSELQSVLQFYSDKIDEYEIKIKDYEAQCTDLKNTCKNLTIRNDALEQKVQNIEQSLLKNYLEIDGVKENEGEEVSTIVDKICDKIKQKKQEILKVYRKKPKNSKNGNGKPSPIVVSLCDGRRDAWIAAAKEARLTSADLGMENDSKIYIRESLTSYTSTLLWQAKKSLKETIICKYVWCKDGIVKARKTDKSKVYNIRSINDIERMVSELDNSN